MSITREVREQIVKEFAIRHNGTFNAMLFLEEVRAQGPAHPAYEWFTWDVAEAALAYQIEQARSFARDLRITFRVEDVVGAHQVRVREEPMPMVISPLAGRSSGGGYVLTNPDDPEHIAEHCRQASKVLTQWRGRYAAALAHCKVSAAEIGKIIGKLERGSTSQRAP